MTQHALVLKYIQQYGSILPAKMAGFKYLDGMFGSEAPKRCRELRAKGVLISKEDGKFERFYPNTAHSMWKPIEIKSQPLFPVQKTVNARMWMN